MLIAFNFVLVISMCVYVYFSCGGWGEWQWNGNWYEMEWNGSLLSCTPAYGLPEMLHIRKCTSAIDLNK